MKESERIEAVVSSKGKGPAWLYRKPDSLWTILRLQGDTGSKFTAKGVIPFEPRNGDRLRMEGTWRISEFNGAREFAFTCVELAIPTDPRALLEYAAAITKGVGPAACAAIWDTYGKDWQAHPELDGVAGIARGTRSEWKETLRRLEMERAKTTAMSYLISRACSMTIALKAWEAWAEGAVGRVNADPYELCALPRVGFLTVENTGIRAAFGIADDDQRRLRAAAIFAMERLTQEHGTLIGLDTLLNHSAMVGIGGGDAAARAVEFLCERGDLVRVEDGVALKADHEAEVKIGEFAA